MKILMINFLELKNFLKSHSINVKTNLSDNFSIVNIASLKNANEFSLTFFHNSKYLDVLKKTNAAACFVSDDQIIHLPKNCLPIIVENPYESFAYTTIFFDNLVDVSRCISKKSSINNISILGMDVSIGDFSYVDKTSFLQNNVVIKNNVVIGPNVKIGKNSVIESGSIISNTTIGDDCIIQSGCAIGDSGFGFTQDNKVPIKHVGNVVIGNNVSIGSNSTIDRASLDSTIISDNVRIDNLVHIAHNVFIGKNTIIAGQTGIAGSSSIGENCKIGGQVGISGHLNIGNNVIIAGKSGVTKNINFNSVIAGFPAIDIKLWKKSIIKNYKNLK